MPVFLCYDVPSKSGQTLLELRNSETLEIIYSVQYQTQAERIFAIRRAQNICYKLGWDIISFSEGTRNTGINRVFSRLES